MKPDEEPDLLALRGLQGRRRSYGGNPLQALVALGLGTEAKALGPHVTLARSHAGPWPGTLIAGEGLRWQVGRCVLVESLRGPPAQYRVLMSRSAAAAGERTPVPMARRPRPVTRARR